MLSNLKKKVEQITESKLDNADVYLNEAENKITITQRLQDTVDSIKDKAESIAVDTLDGAGKVLDTAKSGIASAAEIANMANQLKKVSIRSTEVIEEIDNHLITINSRYEIASFRIGTNIGVMAGFQVGINFSKNKVGRLITDEESKDVSGRCPKCQGKWKVPKLSLMCEEDSKLRCHKCETVFVVEKKTYNVMPLEE